jgi:hypothetical protein
MNFYKQNKIFEKNTSDFENLNKIKIIKQKNKWYFEKNKELYNLSPNSIRRINLSPTISGADKLIENGCKIKNIIKKEIYLSYSESLFLNYDVSLELFDNLFDGWIYNVISNKINVMEGQKIWICNYMNLFYKDAPKIFYVRIDS